MRRLLQILQGLLGLAIAIALAIGVFLVARTIWRSFVGLDEDLAVALLTAATTVIVATLTVVIGRYFERRREADAHFRDKKTEIYDEFLRELFALMNAENPQNESDLVPFLREWQRKMIVWGGAGTLRSYITWMTRLRRGILDADSMFQTEAFFREIRKDLGLSNRGLAKGDFLHLILRNSELFLEMANKNPRVTLAELAAREQELGLSDDTSS